MKCIFWSSLCIIYKNTCTHNKREDLPKRNIKKEENAEMEFSICSWVRVPSELSPIFCCKMYGRVSITLKSPSISSCFISFRVLWKKFIWQRVSWLKLSFSCSFCSTAVACIGWVVAFFPHTFLCLLEVMRALAAACLPALAVCYWICNTINQGVLCRLLWPNCTPNPVSALASFGRSVAPSQMTLIWCNSLIEVPHSRCSLHR